MKDFTRKDKLSYVDEELHTLKKVFPDMKITPKSLQRMLSHSVDIYKGKTNAIRLPVKESSFR